MSSSAQNKSMQIPAKYVKCVRQLIMHQVAYFTKPLPNPDLVKAHLTFETFEEFHPVFLKKIKLDKTIERKMFDTALLQFRSKYNIRSIAVAEYFFYQSLVSDMITQSFIQYFATPDSFVPVLRRIINFMQSLYPETRQVVFGVKLRSWSKSLFSLLGDLVWLLDESAASSSSHSSNSSSSSHHHQRTNSQQALPNNSNSHKVLSKWEQEQGELQIEQRLATASTVPSPSTAAVTPTATTSAQQHNNQNHHHQQQHQQYLTVPLKNSAKTPSPSSKSTTSTPSPSSSSSSSSTVEAKTPSGSASSQSKNQQHHHHHVNHSHTTSSNNSKSNDEDVLNISGATS